MQVKDKVEEDEGGVSLVPSAPPAHVSLSTLLEGEGDLLSVEPPVWVPDSHANTCGRCKAPFRCGFPFMGRMRGVAGPHERVLDSQTDLCKAPFSSQPGVGVAEAAQLPASRGSGVQSIPDASGHGGSPKTLSCPQVAAAHAAPLPLCGGIYCAACSAGLMLLLLKSWVCRWIQTISDHGGVPKACG